MHTGRPVAGVVCALDAVDAPCPVCTGAVGSGSVAGAAAVAGAGVAVGAVGIAAAVAVAGVAVAVGTATNSESVPRHESCDSESVHFVVASDLVGSDVDLPLCSHYAVVIGVDAAVSGAVVVVLASNIAAVISGVPHNSAERLPFVVVAAAIVVAAAEVVNCDACFVGWTCCTALNVAADILHWNHVKHLTLQECMVRVWGELKFACDWNEYHPLLVPRLQTHVQKSSLW